MAGNSHTGIMEDAGEALAPHQGSTKERPRSGDGDVRQHFPCFQFVRSQTIRDVFSYSRGVY
jgi:hypothetical protein